MALYKNKETFKEYLDRVIIEMYNNGASCREIGKHLGISTDNVSRRVGLLGLRDGSNKLSNNKIHQILLMYSRGDNLMSIARECNVNYKTVLNQARKHGIETRRKAMGHIYENSEKLSKEDKDEIIRLYTNGRTADNIGDMFKVSNVTILNVLKKNNIHIRDVRLKIDENVVDNIVLLYNQGVGATDIAKKLGVSRSTVYRKLRNTAEA